jgi:hypothetical protein
MHGRQLMKEVRHRLFLVAFLAIAAILIAGCGDDDKSNEPPVEIEEQLGFGRTGIVERQTRVEGLIRDCMKAQGFDYTPVDPLAQQQALTGKARLSDEEFIKQFGYGISTLFGRGSAQSDPNDRIRKSLPPADRAAYDRALYGDYPGVTFAEAVDTGDFDEIGGCTKQATFEVFGGGAVLTQLVGKLDELDERIVQDQRMRRAAEKWSACVLAKGYRYEEEGEIEEDLTERFQAIVGSGVKPGAIAPPDPNLRYDRAALAKLQSEEVRISVADLECENREVDPVERIVRPQYEAAFRRDNRRLIARVRPPGAHATAGR